MRIVILVFSPVEFRSYIQLTMKFVEKRFTSYLGPYFRYRTYYDWLEMKHGVHVHGLTFMRKRAIFGSIYILTYLLLSTMVSFNVRLIHRRLNMFHVYMLDFFPCFINKDALNDQFYENPLWYRLLYMPLVFTLFRCRFYSAWLLAEFMCMSAGFGAYPSASQPKPG
jgi:lysophospholipid acyltransferase 7